MDVNVGQSTYRFRGAERGDHNPERVWWKTCVISCMKKKKRKKSRPGVHKEFLRERIQKRDGQRGLKEKKVKLKGLFLLFTC